MDSNSLCWQVRSVGFLQHATILFLRSKYGTICLFACLRTATNGGLHEIIGRQEVDRPGWQQDEREPRGSVLAGAKGDRVRATNHRVELGLRDRFRAAAKQSIVGHTTLRARLPPWAAAC